MRIKKSINLGIIITRSNTKLSELTFICKNCMVDSKDNYEFDLGVEGLTHLCECFPGQSSVTLSGITEIIL